MARGSHAIADRRDGLAEGLRTGAPRPGCRLACHSGCHCTHRLKPVAPWAWKTLRPARRAPAPRHARPGARRFTPWPCTEFTSKRVRPRMRASSRRAAPRPRAPAVLQFGARRRSARWSASPAPPAPPGAACRPAPRWFPACRGRWRTAACRAPAPRDEGQRPVVALRVQRQRRGRARLVEVARVHVGRRAGQQHAVGQVQQGVDLASSAFGTTSGRRRPGARSRRTCARDLLADAVAGRHQHGVRPLPVAGRVPRPGGQIRTHASISRSRYQAMPSTSAGVRSSRPPGKGRCFRRAKTSKRPASPAMASATSGRPGR
jgi:hypothetical protein